MHHGEFFPECLFERQWHQIAHAQLGQDILRLTSGGSMPITVNRSDVPLPEMRVSRCLISRATGWVFPGPRKAATRAPAAPAPCWWMGNVSSPAWRWPSNMTGARSPLSRGWPPIRMPRWAHGIGEIGITGTGAAVANAIYNATGKRVRHLPITLDKLM